PSPQRQVLRRRAQQVSPSAAANRRAQIQPLLFAVQEVLGRVDIPTGTQEAAEVIGEVPSLCVARVLLRAPEDVGEQDVDVLLVPVREGRHERRLYGRNGAQ